MSPASGKPNAERLKEAAMAALQAVGGSMQIVNLNKALFYADLFALRDLGETITSGEYLALKLGPVVTAYQRRVVKALEKDGLAVQEEAPDGFGKPLRVVRELTEYKALSNEMLGIIRAVAPAVAKRTANYVSEFSHENPGWKLAYQGEGMPGTPINMRIALQQLHDEDDERWLAEGLSAEEVAAVEAAVGDHDGIPWDELGGRE